MHNPTAWRRSACRHRNIVSIACSRNALAGQSDGDMAAFIARSPRRDKRPPPYAVPLGVVPFDWEVDGAAERIFRAVPRPRRKPFGEACGRVCVFPLTGFNPHLCGDACALPAGNFPASAVTVHVMRWWIGPGAGAYSTCGLVRRPPVHCWPKSGSSAWETGAV
jgi:hypothetical protein